MGIGHLIKYAFSLSPQVAFRGGMRYARRLLSGSMDTARHAGDCSYLPAEPDTEPHRLLPETVSTVSSPAQFQENLQPIIDHRFDLLGSGLVRVDYGMRAPGFEAHKFAPQSFDTADGALVRRLNPGNCKRAEQIRKLISADYAPIDWHVDFKSGYRWPENVVSSSILYGHESGVDIKVPWELARLQHLPSLGLANPGSNQNRYRKEYEDECLDFIAANPPGWGVNWVCTMDVAIRATNMVMAFELIRAKGKPFESSFQGELVASIRAHARHIVRNLEWRELDRGNHYLANIAGLAIIAAFLPEEEETDAWLAFAVQELIQETQFQFLDDGANFEGSTSYHRLSAEMVVYATAAILGLPASRRTALAKVSPSSWRYHPTLSSGIADWNDRFGPFPKQHFIGLQKMAEFSMSVTKPDGCIVQIGDNDNGRFIRLGPQGSALDHRATVAAINGLFGREDLSAFSEPDFAMERRIVYSLAGRRISLDTPQLARPAFIDEPLDQSVATQQTQIEIILPDASALQNLSPISFPDFGLFIWRSARLFLSVRCGQIGQCGRGGHAHNDQLSIELQIDGQDWLADPGSYIYTADPKLRDAYRSTFAHATPRFGEREPSSLGLGMFRLQDNAGARVLQFNETAFHGVHTAFGTPVFRQIKIGDDRITLLDGFGGEQPDTSMTEIKTVRSCEELRKIFNLSLPFSAGYGLRD